MNYLTSLRMYEDAQAAISQLRSPYVTRNVILQKYIFA
jgi:hypothetical protein